MDKPVEMYGPLRTAKTALDVVAMLNDPKKMQEVYDCLKACEAERKRLNDAIATYGKTRDIDKLKIKAQEALRQAEKQLAEAREAAAKIKSDADEWIKTARKQVTAREAKSQAREVATDQAEFALKQRAERFDGEMVKREAAAEKTLAKGESLIQEGNALKDRYEAALAAHKKVAAAA